MTPEGVERLDRKSEVLNEAFAKEVERNVRRREEAGSVGGELAVAREPKDVPIPPDSDPLKRRVMKAATVDASSGRSQTEGSRAVTDESRMDAEEEERATSPEVRQSERQAKNRDENINGGVTNG